MQVAHAQAEVAQVVAEVFGGSFGEGGDQDALAGFDALAAEFDRFVNLVGQGADFDLRVEQAGGANDLFDDEAAARGLHIELFDGLGVAADAGHGLGDGLAGLQVFLGVNPVGVADLAVDEFEGARCGADIDELAAALHEFGEFQRAVVEGAWQAEAVFDQDAFARAVALVHAADLRDGGVALVNEDQGRGGEEVEQGAR